jgi:DNA-binding MarR family transcriptional regulator
MLAVRRLGTVSMSDLASQLGVSPPSASAMVDRLVEKKILTREHSTEDRRKVVVRISDNAMSMMDGIEKNMLGVFIDLVEKIGPKTTAKWCQVLKRVESVLASNQPKSRRKHNEPGN